MLKNTHIWLPSYLKQCLLHKRATARPMHVIFCLADHFEPRWGRVDKDTEIKRTERWISKYLPLAQKHHDCDGVIPRYSFFYPIDEFTPEVFEKVADVCKQGYGEAEVHLHHDNDNAENLKVTLDKAKEQFSKYGALAKDKLTGEVEFGFIHGNWSLDNSRKDGRWCGVNNELEILQETGCYADFTLPSAPSDTQTSKINSIYYAKDTPEPKSHNIGVDVEMGKKPGGDLMLIQGPLALNWKNKKFGIIPRIENSGITFSNPATADRIDLWVEQNICVKGKPEWIFVKVYTHGCQDNNLSDEYFENFDGMLNYLESKYNDGVNYKLHYVTAREMYNIVKAAEAGMKGEPGEYRNYLLERNI